jgi:ribosomal subunit interface protein
MAERPTVVTTFKDLPTDERVRETIEKRCTQLAEEFPEVTRFEISLAEDGSGYAVHGHVTGKGRDLGAQAEASALAPAADRLLEKVARQLRKFHDKQIFAQRREAQRDPPKRKTSAS